MILVRFAMEYPLESVLPARRKSLVRRPVYFFLVSPPFHRILVSFRPTGQIRRVPPSSCVNALVTFVFPSCVSTSFWGGSFGLIVEPGEVPKILKPSFREQSSKTSFPFLPLDFLVQALDAIQPPLPKRMTTPCVLCIFFSSVGNFLPMWAPGQSPKWALPFAFRRSSPFCWKRYFWKLDGAL